TMVRVSTLNDSLKSMYNAEKRGKHQKHVDNEGDVNDRCETMKKVRNKIGKYEVGRTIGEGTFAKVKFAKNTDTGDSVAIKVMAKSIILKHRLVEQVSTSKTKIYIILEFVMGGKLYDKIAQQNKLSENDSRHYFQQLIDVVAHCHKKGVYHRDFKPENLLDAFENLKVSDFRLSALIKVILLYWRMNGVDVLHTTCGTPNYVAPEVLGNQGYDGAAADVWSCGVILYVLMARYLLFEEADLPALYNR
ncbi:hypothetical protein S83_055505, partial [Arachis hypogaea]